MAANAMGAAGEMLNGIAHTAETIRELGNRLYEADPAWKELLRQVDRMKEKNTQWNWLGTTFELTKDEELMNSLCYAQGSLHELLSIIRNRKEGGEETLSKFHEALFPSLIGRSIDRAVQAIEDVQKRLEDQHKRRIAVQRNVLAGERLLSFSKHDHRYVRLEKTEQDVTWALLDPNGHNVILLHGGPGKGKSTLARYLALQIQLGIRALSQDKISLMQVQTNRKAADMRADGQTSPPDPSNPPDHVMYDVIDDPVPGRHLVQIGPAQLSEKFHRVVFLECSMDSADGFVQRESEVVQRELRQKLVGWMEDGGGAEVYERQTSLQNLLHERKVLIILDNVWASSFLRRTVYLAEGALNVKWLVTSQNKNLCHRLNFSSTLIHMETASLEDARRLFVRHIRRSRDGETIDTIPKQVQGLADELIDKVDTNLLAIACLATAIDPKKIDDVEEWKEVRRDYFHILRARETAEIFNVDYPGSYWAAMHVSFERLHEGVKRLLVLIGLCEATSMPQEVLEYLYGKTSQRMDSRAFKTAKLDLEARDLMQVRDKSCSVHDLLRKFVNDDENNRDLKKSILTELSKGNAVSEGRSSYREGDVLGAVIFLYFKRSFTAKKMDFKITTPIDGGTRRRKRHVLEPVMRLLVKDKNEDWTSNHCRYVRQVFLKYVKEDCVDEKMVEMLLRGADLCARIFVMEFLERCYHEEPISPIMDMGEGTLFTCRHVINQVVHSRLTWCNSVRTQSKGLSEQASFPQDVGQKDFFRKGLESFLKVEQMNPHLETKVRRDFPEGVEASRTCVPEEDEKQRDFHFCVLPPSEKKEGHSNTSWEEAKSIGRKEDTELESRVSQDLKVQVEMNTKAITSAPLKHGKKSSVEDCLQQNGEREFAPRKLDGVVSNSCTMYTESMKQKYQAGSGEFQIRSDVQNLGFTSWEQEFSPHIMLLMCDFKSSEHEIHIVCFHTEAMASLFGVGVAFSIISINLPVQSQYEIWIEEIMEESWKNYWGHSCENTWSPVLVKGGNGTLKDATNMSSLTRDEALSKFGISVDGVEDQEFLNLNHSTGLNSEDANNFQPRWIKLFTALVQHMQHAKKCNTIAINCKDDEQRLEEGLKHHLCHPTCGTLGINCHDSEDMALLCSDGDGVLDRHDSGEQSFCESPEGNADNFLHTAPRPTGTKYIKTSSEADLMCDQSHAKCSDGSEAEGIGEEQTLHPSRERCDQSASRKRKYARKGHDSIDQRAAPKPGVKIKVGEGKKVLVVNVVFMHPGCNLYRRNNSTGVLEQTTTAVDMPSSSIKPTLIIEFMHGSGGANRLKTTLGSEYQFDSEEHGSQAGWYQDKFELSFRHNIPEHLDIPPVCDVDSHHIISGVVQGESKVMKQSGWGHAELVESNTSGSLQSDRGWVLGLIPLPSFTKSRRTERSKQSNDTNQLVSKVEACRLADNRLIAIKPACKPGLLAYKLHSLIDPVMPDNPQWKDIKATGMYSDFGVKVAGEWDVFGEGKEAYEFSAKKALSRYTNLGGANMAQSRTAGNEGRAFAAGNNSFPDRGNEPIHTLWQIFNRKFILNHKFSEFFESLRKDDPYRWFLRDLSNHGNVVTKAIKLSISDPSANQAVAPVNVLLLPDRTPSPVSPSPPRNGAPDPASHGI